MRGNIRDWEVALQSRVNWGWLSSAFGSSISPSDIDFIVERWSYFLVGEIKREREQIMRGQKIMLTRLAGLPPVTVFYLVGDIRDHEIYPEEMLIEGHEQWFPVGRREFFLFCREWIQWANRTRAPWQASLIPWYQGFAERTLAPSLTTQPR